MFAVLEQFETATK